GLLQGLHDVGVLAQVDYLSTVSGGGYVGGFWTAWRLKQRNAAADASATATAIGEAVFPVRRAPEGGSASDQNPQPPGGSAAQPATASVPNGEPEPPPIRHLREFGRFLVPRFGLFEVETWNCVVAVLGGILPSLLAATAVVVMGWLLWLVVGVVMMEGLAAGQAGLGRALAFILAVFCTGAMHASVPMLEEDRQSHERRAGVVVLFLLAGIVAVVVLRPWSFIPAATLSFLLFLETRWLSGNHASHGRRPKERVAFYGSALVAIGVTASMAIWISDWGEMPSLEGLLFDVGVNGILAPVDAGLPLILGWLAASLTLLLLRLVVLSLGRSRKAKDEDLARKAKDERLTWLRVIERNAGRMLLLALLWACVTGGWALAEWVVEEGSRRVGGLSLTTAGLISAVAWLRRWLMAPPSTSRLSSGFGRVLRMVGKAAYAVGANIALAAFVVLVATGLQLARLYGIPLVALLAVALPLILLTWLFLDPSKLGLHDFYRGRIARAFL
ncbi:MAG: hypothetical protein L6Q38_19235, partial [Nitrospira sp.]|nr:hypothetical protein [Nitrospira sp.]